MSDRIFCDKCHTLYIPGERHGCIEREEVGCSFCSNPAVIVDRAGKSSCASCAADAIRVENDFKSKEVEKKGQPVKKGFDVNKPHHSETQTAFKTCAGNCNSYANKSIHEDDGSLTFYCERCFPLAKRTCIASGCSTEFVPTEEGDYRNYCPKCAAQWRDAKKRLEESNPFRKSEKSVDAVNYPKHYNSHPSGVECITVTEHMTFNLGNATKYIWRCGEKGNIIQDLEKAIWYVNREIDKIKREKLAK